MNAPFRTRHLANALADLAMAPLNTDRLERDWQAYRRQLDAAVRRNHPHVGEGK